MKFDAKNCMMLINAYPSGMVRPELFFFADYIGIPTKAIRIYLKKGVETAMNSAIKRVALRSSYDWFLFAEGDVRPSRETVPMLTAPYDVCCAVVWEPRPGTWREPTAFHANLWRVHREVLEKMPPPWFHRTLSADGTEEEHCICDNFRRKAISLGFTVGHAGTAGHVPGEFMAFVR